MEAEYKESERIKRWANADMDFVLSYSRVALISGCRQCGKSTLARHYLKGDGTYSTLDDLATLEQAEINPSFFLAGSRKPHIIDEVQKVPSLIPQIKMMVDVDNKPGQFVLTGSADIRKLPTVRESLAGRVAYVRLRTLAQGEIEGKAPQFLSQFRAWEWPQASDVAPCDKGEVVRRAVRGGYPAPLRYADTTHRRWLNDYISSIMEQDLHEVAPMRRASQVRAMLVALAAHNSKIISTDNLFNSLNIARETGHAYINLLECLFLVERIPAWSRTDYGRIGKSPKFMITDTGLACALMQRGYKKIMEDGELYGKLIEAFVAHELQCQLDLDESRGGLFHYRDRDKREIDFIVDCPGSPLLGVEVKGSSVISQHDFRHMRWFRDKVAKPEDDFHGIIFYLGDKPLVFQDKMAALPVSLLWS